jgi:CHASE2 domain-containing sensor protein
MAYDHLIRSRPIEPTDPRLLIITLTDEDVRSDRRQTQSGSISDGSLEKLLNLLNRSKPSAIGLDIYRDFKTELPALKSQLATNDRLVIICPTIVQTQPPPKTKPTQQIRWKPPILPSSIGIPGNLCSRWRNSWL